MGAALLYLVRHTGFHIVEFFRHWYVHSAHMYWNKVIDGLGEIDYTLAWRLTLRNLFQPLYGDFSPIGYVLGFVFRIGRLAVGTAVYAVILTFAAVVYALWLMIPPALLFKAFTG